MGHRASTGQRASASRPSIATTAWHAAATVATALVVARAVVALLIALIVVIVAAFLLLSSKAWATSHLALLLLAPVVIPLIVSLREVLGRSLH